MSTFTVKLLKLWMNEKFQKEKMISKTLTASKIIFGSLNFEEKKSENIKVKTLVKNFFSN